MAMRYKASNHGCNPATIFENRFFRQCLEMRKHRRQPGFSKQARQTPTQFVMNASILAHAPGVAQLSRIEQIDNVDERRISINTLPNQWRDGLLAFDGHKRPVSPATGRLLNNWPTAVPPSFEQLVRAQAVGIRTGAITSTLAFDFDGPNSWGYFKKVFGDYPWHVLPPSIAWTSGRDDRRQVGFSILKEHQHLLENKVKKFGDLEFRWNNQASVICGKHPYTAGYSWIEDCAPYQRRIATLPLEIIQMIPNKKITTKSTEIYYQNVNYDLVVPLDSFITYSSSLLVKNGSNEGCCNDDAIRLSVDLVATENWLMVQKVGVDRTAQDLFDEYVSNCPDRVNGKPLNRQAMQGRFDGAVRLQPVPPTPEHKLIERLNYQKRQAAKFIGGAV